MHFCPGTMTTHAESINSDLQRGLDSRAYDTQHWTQNITSYGSDDIALLESTIANAQDLLNRVEKACHAIFDEKSWQSYLIVFCTVGAEGYIHTGLMVMVMAMGGWPLLVRGRGRGWWCGGWMVNSGKMFETLGLCKLKEARDQTDGVG